MTFELLYFDGCPSWKITLQNLRQVLSEMGWKAEIHLINILDDTQAEKQKFQGSPSIRYNGVDLWPSPQDDYHLGCRVYSTPYGLKGSPTVEMLRLRLRELNQ
ncbi:MAG: thioredoxin family protein [Anaerolineaceae bacterium]